MGAAFDSVLESESSGLELIHQLIKIPTARLFSARNGGLIEDIAGAQFPNCGVVDHNDHIFWFGEGGRPYLHVPVMWERIPDKPHLSYGLAGSLNERNARLLLSMYGGKKENLVGKPMVIWTMPYPSLGEAYALSPID